MMQLVFKVLRRNRKLGIISRFIIIDFLLIYFSSLLPWYLKVLLAALWLFPYLGITVAKTKLTCRLCHRIRKCNSIGIDNTAGDPAITTAILDRILQKSEIIQLQGD